MSKIRQIRSTFGSAYDHVFVPKHTWWGRALQALAKLALLFGAIAVAACWMATTLNNNDKVSTTVVTICEVEGTSTDKGQELYLIETSDGDDYSLEHPDGAELRTSTAYTITHDGLDRIISFKEALDATPAGC